MKIVMCIADQKAAPGILAILREREYRVTELASEGGFMKRGNVTYLIGVDKDNVSEVLQVIQDFKAKDKRRPSAHRALAVVLNAESGGTYMR